MENQQGMPKVDLSKHRAQINPTTLEHMKIMENLNVARVKSMKKNQRTSNLIAVGLGLSVIGTYLYSMFAVRQESFLDDFEEPELKSDK